MKIGAITTQAEIISLRQVYRNLSLIYMENFFLKKKRFQIFLDYLERNRGKVAFTVLS